tara:strand:- start:284 stop:616 length:333 start_codon:yes stop_codon:yes gene_type:complete
MSKLQVDDIVNKDDTGSVGFSKGVVVTGVVTATSFSGNGSGLIGVASTDNIITGTAATFNNVVKVGTAITMDATSGIVTATSFSGDGINLTNVGAAQSTRTLQVWLFGGG